MIAEAVVSKWGNSVAVCIPKNMQDKLNLNVDEKVELVLKDNVLQIQKPRKSRNLREIIFEKTGMTIEEYAERHPYEPAEYVEFGRVGGEEI